MLSVLSLGTKWKVKMEAKTHDLDDKEKHIYSKYVDFRLLA